MIVSLRYGENCCFTCEIDPGRILACQHAPKRNPHLREDLRAALAQPLEFPPMAQAVIPDDRVVLALDRHTPEAGLILEEIWKVLEGRGVRAENVVVLQPASLTGKPLTDPRRALPPEASVKFRWTMHDPTDEANCAYLASTASGERIYLARDLVEADVVISIGPIAYDSVIGYRGTSSVFYPGLSSTEAVVRAHGLGHAELGPDDHRPLRQIMDEIAWLLGTQFSIQVVAAEGAGASAVLAGATDAVLRRGKQLLADSWMVELDTRPSIVVASVDADAAGHGWEQIGAAMAAARNVVAKDGRIVILSELDDELSAGLDIIRAAVHPREALKPLRNQAPRDLVTATHLARAVDWAKVYLLSGVDDDLVEDLFIVPLGGEREVQRLLGGEETCLFLESAQHVYAHVKPA